jgi:hypothetical protein
LPARWRWLIESDDVPPTLDGRERAPAGAAGITYTNLDVAEVVAEGAAERAEVVNFRAVER